MLSEYNNNLKDEDQEVINIALQKRDEVARKRMKEQEARNRATAGDLIRLLDAIHSLDWQTSARLFSIVNLQQEAEKLFEDVTEVSHMNFGYIRAFPEKFKKEEEN